MRNREISRQLQRLDSIITRTNDACRDNIEIQAYWAQYICILSAGLLENALKEIYSEFAYRTVSEPIANFVSSTLGQIRNPKTQRFIETATAFKSDWKEDLENFLDTDGRREAIDTIMLNRHLIAHGKNQNCNISLAQIKEYLSEAVEVIDFIEDQCQK